MNSLNYLLRTLSTLNGVAWVAVPMGEYRFEIRVDDQPVINGTLTSIVAFLSGVLFAQAPDIFYDMIETVDAEKKAKSNRRRGRLLS